MDVTDLKLKIKRCLDSRLVRETSWSFLLKVSQTGFSFLSAVFLARILGAEGYGIYAYAMAFVTLLFMPAQAGLPQLVVRETARGIAKENPEMVKGIWLWAIKVALLVSLSITLVVGSIFFFLKGYHFGLKERTFLWALLLALLVSLVNLSEAGLRGLHKIVMAQLPNLLIRPVLFLFFLSLTFLWGKQVSPSQALALNVSAVGGAFFVGVWFLYRHTPLSVLKARSTFKNKEWLWSLLPLAFISSMAIINSKADVVMLGIFKPAAQVGIYRVAAQMAILASFGLRVINMVVVPRFATLYVKGQKRDLQRLVKHSAQAMFVFNVIVTSFFVLFGKPFLKVVFGKNFVYAYVPLLILLLGQTVNSATGSVGFLLNMTGHEKDTARGMALAAGINIVLNVFFIPPFGPKGAAFATAVSMITWNIVLWRLVQKRLGINTLAFNLKMGKIFSRQIVS